MPFSQSDLVSVDPPVWTGREMRLGWTSSTPGLTWQVYANGTLVWHGTDTQIFMPWPTAKVHFDIGSVGTGEATTNYNATLPFGVGPFGSSGFGLVPMLPYAPSRRASIGWTGGTFQDTSGNRSVSGFRVYGEDTPGGGVNYAKILADIPAYPGGFISDGFGYGGYGDGGFGMAPASYSWSSSPLSAGTWTFAVKTYDVAGNEGPAATQAVTIASPPSPPAVFAGTMTRLAYTLDGFGYGGFGGGLLFGDGGYGDGSYGGGIGFGECAAILAWNPSPS